MMTDRMEQRVATLLKKAEDLRRHGEDGSAEAALQLAERIMMKYSIDAAVIAARRAETDKPEQIVIARVPFTGIYRRALLIGLNQVVLAFNTCRTFERKDGTTEYLHVVGFESDVKQLKLLLVSLNLQAVSALNRWWRSYPDRDLLPGMAGYKTRRQFVISFASGATERVRRSRQVVISESSTPGTEVALLDRRTAVDAFVDERLNLTSGHQTRMFGGNGDARSAGRDAGLRANTGETSVSGDRRRLSR